MVTANVSGAYHVYAGNFTGNDVRDEILFSASGSAADHLWAFAPDGSPASSLVTTSATGHGYVLEGANDRLMTWTAGSAPFIWQLAGSPLGNRSSGNSAVPAGYQPLVGSFVGTGASSSVLWYAPGAQAERLYTSSLATPRGRGRASRTPVR